MAEKYFVTGATGAIGSALIPLLLEDQDSRIWVLIRADSSEHLKKRFEELFVFWDMEPELAEGARQRIIPLLGDTEKSKFALSDEIYDEIASQCTHIIHCAGVVRMNLPLDVARKHALGSAKNIVDLALACMASGSLKKVEYVSTVGVAGRMSGLVPETWITQPREFHNTYEQSKAEAEDYLREQIERYRLPVTVHRPSMVVGDSKTGKIISYQIFYHICEFLSGRKTFGLLPNLGNATLDTIPVDYVVNVLKRSSQRQDSVGKVFHLCSGPTKAIQLAELRRISRGNMRRQGLKLPVIISLPMSVFDLLIYVISLLVSGKTQRTLKSFSYFLDYLADEQGFDNSFTCQNLAIPTPSNNKYLELVLREYLQKYGK